MFLMKFHRDLYVPITFGHLEHLTDELVEEYRAWLQTDEGKQYLPGGMRGRNVGDRAKGNSKNWTKD